MLQVRREASSYWWLRAALAPLTLLNMALSGVLQVQSMTLIMNFASKSKSATNTSKNLAVEQSVGVDVQISHPAVCSGLQARRHQRSSEHWPVHCGDLRKLCGIGCVPRPSYTPAHQPGAGVSGVSGIGYSHWYTDRPLQININACRVQLQNIF